MFTSRSNEQGRCKGCVGLKIKCVCKHYRVPTAEVLPVHLRRSSDRPQTQKQAGHELGDKGGEEDVVDSDKIIDGTGLPPPEKRELRKYGKTSNSHSVTGFCSETMDAPATTSEQRKGNLPPRFVHFEVDDQRASHQGPPLMSDMEEGQMQATRSAADGLDEVSGNGKGKKRKRAATPTAMSVGPSGSGMQEPAVTRLWQGQRARRCRSLGYCGGPAEDTCRLRGDGGPHSQPPTGS